MIIAVTGSPATGKTALAKRLAKELGFEHIDLNRVIEEKGWHEGRDEKRDTLVVDETTLTKRVKSLIKPRKSYVIDSHLSHFISPELVNVCIVCTCELKELKKRLEKRGYAPEKVRENLDAEIFENCRIEAEENGHKIIIIETSAKSAEVLAKMIQKKLEGRT